LRSVSTPACSHATSRRHWPPPPTPFHLDPDAPEGYRLRGEIHRLTGDYLRASADHAQAAARDPCAAKAEQIRGAVQGLRELVTTDRIVEVPWNPSAVRTPALRQILANRGCELARVTAAIARPDERNTGKHEVTRPHSCQRRQGARMAETAAELGRNL
jgi:hypothetical protein